MNKNIKTLVIGTALSAESDGIVKAGAAIARATGATPWLVHAYSLPAFPSEIGAFDGQWIEEQTLALRQRLTDQVEESGIGGLAGFQDQQACLVFGAPYREIVELARRVKADLIVVGASEGGALHRAFLGSTADRVVRKAPCPVLVVRREAALPPSRVLIPVDFSPVSANALRYGLSFLKETGAAPKVEALFALNPLEVAGSLQFTPDQIQRFAGAELRRFLDETGAPATVEAEVLTGYPREEILFRMEERQADLVVLGTHGRGGFDRLLIGSVAAQVLERAASNVLIVPPMPVPWNDSPETAKRADADWSFVSDEAPAKETAVTSA